MRTVFNETGQWEQSFTGSTRQNIEFSWLKSGLKYVNEIVDENGIKPFEWFTDK